MAQTVYWVYILLCENQNFYTGYTNDLDKRYQLHLDGKASKYTRSFKPICIAQSWEVEDKAKAMRIECYIKKLSRIEKEKIIKKPALLLNKTDCL